LPDPGLSEKGGGKKGEKGPPVAQTVREKKRQKSFDKKRGKRGNRTHVLRHPHLYEPSKEGEKRKRGGE